MGDAYIAALEPYGLAVVPGYDGTKRDGFRVRWRAWRDAIIRLRAELLEACEEDTALQAAQIRLCSEDFSYFVTIFAWIDEPRPRKGENFYKEFVPSAAQVELVQWFQRKTEDPEPFDGYISKCRGWGATRIVIAGLAIPGWLFRIWRGLVISRKEDLVDKPQDLNSMLGYADFVIEHLPGWMLPEGYNERYHRLKLMIKNPETGSQITGESTTTKAGRGARATYAIIDEAAFVPEFTQTFGTLSGTTDHRFALSTESFEESKEWYLTWKKYEHDTDRVKQLNWTDNPWFDEYWFEEERARWEHDPEGFEREVMRDPWSGFGQAVYPGVEHVPDVDYTFNPDAPLLIGIDPGYADDTALVFAQFATLDDGIRHLIWLDSFEKNLQPAEFFAHILTGIPPRLGDKCWGLTFSPRDTEFMAWLRPIPYGMLRTFCDPAGSQKDMSGLSFVERIAIETRRLRKREFEEGLTEAQPKGIVPLYKDLFAKNRHDSRRSAMRGILPNSRFSYRDGARRLRNAFRNYSFNEPGAKATGQPAPIHDEWSHLVSAAEYLAVYVDLGVAEPRVLVQEAA
jgi:hypothetical protein